MTSLGLNGGPDFKHSEAFSFQIATDNQEETDRYWNAIVGNGGQESQCGWCKDITVTFECFVATSRNPASCAAPRSVA